MVTVPVRLAALGFAAKLRPTVPFAEPEAPLLTVIHAAFEEAVQEQPEVEDTPTEDVEAELPTERLFEPSVYWHAAAAWVTVTVWPATVTVPVRLLVLVFALTASVTLPLPEPEEPEVIVIQLALEEAVHEQPELDETDAEREVPAAGAEREVAFTV